MPCRAPTVSPELPTTDVRLPSRLIPLIDDGIIDYVVRPLLSGKEAEVYLVESRGELRAAKVFKEANERSFHNRSVYAEGRKVRNSRDQRAMGKRSRHGRERDEEHWKSVEADIIYRLHEAGVRVPRPYAFVDGVLVMECITGEDGGPAPRLAECDLEPEYALELGRRLIREVVRMLCAGVVHGDLSLFNVLLEEDGPVVIDFPQAVNAARNNNAKALLLRDVANLTSHLMSEIPAEQTRFAHEMWALYETGELRPDSPMTGRFDLPQHEVDAELLLTQMLAIEEDEAIADADDDFGFEAPRVQARVVTRPADDDDAVKRRALAAAEQKKALGSSARGRKRGGRRRRKG